MPRGHAVRARDVDLKRLGSVLAVAYERDLRDFASLLLVENLGPRTLADIVAGGRSGARRTDAIFRPGTVFVRAGRQGPASLPRAAQNLR